MNRRLSAVNDKDFDDIAIVHSLVLLEETLALIAISLEVALVVVCTVVVDAAYNVALGIAVNLGIALLLGEANNLALFVFDIVRHKIKPWSYG